MNRKYFFEIPPDWKDQNAENSTKNCKYLPNYEGFNFQLSENMQETHLTSFELFEISNLIFFIYYNII